MPNILSSLLATLPGEVTETRSPGPDVVARRRRIKKDFDLPMKGESGEFVRRLVSTHDDVIGRDL
jgi:hypothetical protein